MTKILYYIDKTFFHFGIANELSKEKQFESYVIFDVNYLQKEFFQKQKFVNFKNQWFLQDEIEVDEKNIDIDYLIKIEEKYNVNFWQLAYSERLFLEYNEYYNFSKNQILSIFEKQCKFFERIIDEIKPEYLLLRPTDWNRNHLLLLICKGANIPVLMLTPTRFSERCHIAEDFDKFSSTNNQNEKIFGSIEEIKKFIYKKDKADEFSIILKRGEDISISKKSKLFFKFLNIIKNDQYKKFYENFGRTRTKIIKNELKKELNSKKHEEFLFKISEKEITQKPYVFFPLHYQPERDTLIQAPYANNQLEIIEHIAKSLPINYSLYVKEHPVMRIRGWREPEYYKKILSFPNVKIIHPNVKARTIIEQSDLIVTINGTIGIEALIEKKPVITFVETSYSKIRGVEFINDHNSLPKAIRKLLKVEINEGELIEYCNYVMSNSFSLNFTSLHTKLWDRFYFQRFFSDNPISEESMDEYLKENTSVFKKLADEHKSRINRGYSNE